MREPRVLGRVRHVLGPIVTVELDPAIAGVSPVLAGRLQQVGQIGSLVRIPQGPVSLIAAVVLVGIAELSPPLPPAQAPNTGNRWLQVQLLGEVDSVGKFRRGVGTYPALDDAVLILRSDELSAVFPGPGPGRVRLGRMSAAGGVPVTLDARSLVVRHGAIVGSTGAGKSSLVSLIVQRICQQWPSASVVVVDPHGEYAAALSGVASVRSVTASAAEERLNVPHWALPAQDLLQLLAGKIEGANTSARFAELVTGLRQEFAGSAAWTMPDQAAIGPDLPIPFDVREAWFRLDSENRATTIVSKNDDTRAVKEMGEAATLKKTAFEQYAQGSGSPYQGPRWNNYLTTPDRMRVRLGDPRLAFLLTPNLEDAKKVDPLPKLIEEWLGGKKPVSVLDFSGVSTEASDLAIGLVVRLIFEVALRGRDDGIGRAHPVFIVLEEAHRYLGQGQSVRIAREAVNRVAREGRKHGIGLLLVSQRPSELPDTALSQVGTVIALRLTNGADQSTVRAALPDAVSGLSEVLPSLRTGEALVSGEAVALPVRVALDAPSPWPRAEDPELASWAKEPKTTDVLAAVERWRTEEGG